MLTNYHRIVLSIFCFVVFQNMRCQLYVPEHSVLHVNQIFTTQESLNQINQSLTGQVSLTFNAEQKQVLQSSKDHTSLPGLSLENTVLDINSGFYIQNDISLASSNLTVNEDIFLEGLLKLDTFSLISGQENIHTQIQASPDGLPHSHLNLHEQLVSLSEHQYSYPSQDLEDKHRNAIRLHKEMSYKSVYISQPTPPPMIR